MTTACIGVTLLVLAPYANISSPSRLFRPMHHLHHPESALGRRAAAVDYKYAETIETTTGSADIVAANEVAATEMASAVGANTDDAATTHGTIEPAPLVLPPPTKENAAAISPVEETQPLWLLIGIGTVPRSGEGQT